MTITEVNMETGEVLGTYEYTAPRENTEGIISNEDYQIIEGKLVVKAHMEATPDYGWFGGYGITTFDRAYRVFLRRKRINAPTPKAENASLLITQRSFCTQIQFGKCISKIPSKPYIDLTEVFVAEEYPFDITDLYDIQPEINADQARGSIRPRGPRYDFAFKKGIIRKIEQAMIASTNSPFRYEPGKVGYLQSKYFQKRLLKALPASVLNEPIKNLAFVDAEVKESLSGNATLKELFAEDDIKLAKKFGMSKGEFGSVKSTLLKKLYG